MPRRMVSNGRKSNRPEALIRRQEKPHCLDLANHGPVDTHGA
jgi:hypothetical protein